MRFSNWEALCVLAKDSSYPSRMEGPMHVCEPGCHKFSQRYAILKGNLLFIFQKKSDQAPCFLIPADGFNLDICENSQGYNFRLNSIGGQETTGWFEFVAPSKEQFRAWIEALISCSYTELSNGSGMFEKELQSISKATEQEDALETDVETNRGYGLSRSGTVDAKYSRNQSFASLLSKFESEVLGKFYRKR
ncbi:PH domain containing protein [Trichuris trichiura]|uniref:PH domain containing protein n=1 Tax=Trichuris trichiura TaxID=36087 RepID=A0A077Z038_TRITR|nr:PH domain containing protein [Trichuris trichiura]